MKVTATIDRWDLVRLNLYLLPRMRANWIAMATFTIVLFTSLIFLGPRRVTPPVLLEYFAWSLGGALVAMAFGSAVCGQRGRRFGR